MYFIKKIALDENQSYQSSKIVDHSDTESSADLLENAVKTFTKEELGREASEQIKILDIKDLSQVNEPLVDGMLAYRLADNPNRIHVYQRKSFVVKGYIYGSKPTSQFRRTHIFEAEEYANLNINVTTAETRETVTFITARPIARRPAGFNFIDHLKKNPRFQARFTLVSQSTIKPDAPSAPEPIVETMEIKLVEEPKQVVTAVPIECMEANKLVSEICAFDLRSKTVKVASPTRSGMYEVD